MKTFPFQYPSRFVAMIDLLLVFISIWLERTHNVFLGLTLYFIFFMSSSDNYFVQNSWISWNYMKSRIEYVGSEFSATVETKYTLFSSVFNVPTQNKTLYGISQVLK